MAKYRCKHCGKVVDRKSKKRWIPSICGTIGRDVRLMRVTPYKPRGIGS